MKLALIISSLSGGGAERVLSLLANHWAARGVDVSLITIDGHATDCYPLDARVRRKALNLSADSAGLVAAVANNWRRMAALRSALDAIGATVVLSFGEQTNVQVLFATRFKPIRCVISERTDPSLHPVGPIWHALRRLAYPMADALVVQTDALLPWAQAIVGKHSAHVVPNPVRDMRHITGPQRTVRGAVVVAAGRLVAAKGFDVLLEAFASAGREWPEWKLVILGEGPERKHLTELARKLGIMHRVSLVGWVAEPGEALAGASVFVLSSRYEGFPNALLEAMACGLPVIATTCLGPAQIISDEIDGLLVKVDSAAELSAAMRRLMKDEKLRDRLGNNAAKVSTRYKFESVVQQWDRLLGVEVTATGAALRRTPVSLR